MTGRISGRRGGTGQPGPAGPAHRAIRIYRFENGGAPEFFIGSADLMTRNLSRRMEVVAPVCDPVIKNELDSILRTYEEDNCSAWDMQPDGQYLRRHPAAGEARRGAHQVFIQLSV